MSLVRSRALATLAGGDPAFLCRGLIGLPRLRVRMPRRCRVRTARIGSRGQQRSEGLRVAVRVRPDAARTTVDERHDDALIVCVTARPAGVR